jgi:hypothetical protein
MPLYPPPGTAVTTLTTKGDILGHTGSALGRLPAGTNGKPLVYDSSQTLGLRAGPITAFTVTGVNADRVLDADNTTLNELLNVFGTFLQDTGYA